MDEDDRHGCLALAYHSLGGRREADRELEALRALDGDSGAYHYAEIYAQWGEPAAALRWLTSAERLRIPDLVWLKEDRQLEPIRNESAFKAIEQRLNFPA